MDNNICFIGKYDRKKLQVLLEEIEKRFPNVLWSGYSKPSWFNPLGRIEEKYVALELKDRKLTYFTDHSKEVYEEDIKTYMKGRTLVTFEEFMNGTGTEQEIENEMDISFLYG